MLEGRKKKKGSLPDVTQYFMIDQKPDKLMVLENCCILTILLVTFQRNVFNNSYRHQKSQTVRLIVSASCYNKDRFVHFLAISACGGWESAYLCGVTVLERAEQCPNTSEK